MYEQNIENHHSTNRKLLQFASSWVDPGTTLPQADAGIAVGIHNDLIFLMGGIASEDSSEIDSFDPNDLTVPPQFFCDPVCYIAPFNITNEGMYTQRAYPSSFITALYIIIYK